MPKDKIVKSLVVSYAKPSLILNFGQLNDDGLYNANVNPQEFNRYSYDINNPLKYIDPDGNQAVTEVLKLVLTVGSIEFANFWNPVGWTILGVMLGVAAGLAYYQYQDKQDAKKAAAKSNTASASNNNNKNKKGKKNVIDEKRTDHIFRSEGGHFTEDTPANRAALEDCANNPDNFNGIDGNGNSRYSQMNPDGTQTWAIVRDGYIVDGGINLDPLRPPPILP